MKESIFYKVMKKLAFLLDFETSIFVYDEMINKNACYQNSKVSVYSVNSTPFWLSSSALNKLKELFLKVLKYIQKRLWENVKINSKKK